MTHAHSAFPPSPDTVWPQLRADAESAAAREPLLAPLAKIVQDAQAPHQALAKTLAPRLTAHNVGGDAIEALFAEALQADPEIEAAMLHDMVAIRRFDPATRDMLVPFLFFKGFHALQTYRVAHVLWRQGRELMALFLQNRVSDLFGVDIHPAAKIGHGVMMDHATGIVIGETAIVEDDVLFWHGVTLGGTSKDSGDRHPKVRKGALLGANSTIIGPIEIGAGARVAAGSVVVKPVPAHATVAGQPAHIIKKSED